MSDKRYYTLILQPKEPGCLAAAMAMTAYIGDKLDVITLSISENQISELVQSVMREMESGEMDRNTEGR